MSKSKEIIDKLQTMGSPSIKKVLMNHGAREPFYGVKVEELKKIQKQVKKDYKLAMELFDSGISDAMYLAGLIADETQMTKKDIHHWAEKAYWYMLSEYPVAWVASESKHGLELALEWIDSDKENIATAGWCTLSSIMSIKPNEELDIPLFRKLLERVEKNIHKSSNRVRHTMNGFVIATGSYIPELTKAAIEAAAKIGKVSVDMGGTACRVPDAIEYINKVKEKGAIGKKRKMARC